MTARGFTLIEVIVAIAIMSFLSLFTVQSLRRAIETKQKMQRDIDKNSTVRDAMRVIERDINMAFNYRDVGVELYNQAQDERKKLATTPVANNNNNNINNANKPPPPPPPPVAVDGEKYKHKAEDKNKTQFIGEAETLNFTSLSNVRMMEDSPVCSQAEIGYYLKGCRRRSNQEQSSKCLWRRVSDFIHEDITREGTETVLLENVTEFKLRYLGPGKEQEWVDTWISNERGDGTTQGKFPYAVEVTIEVFDSTAKVKDKKLRMTIVAAVRNPNNPKPKNADGTTPDGTNVDTTNTTQQAQ